MNDDRGMGDPPMTGSGGVGRPGDGDGVPSTDAEAPGGTGTMTPPPGAAGNGAVGHGAAGSNGLTGNAAQQAGAAGGDGAGPRAAAGVRRAPARRSAQRSRTRRRLSWWVELIALFALALFIMLVIKTYIVQAFFIPSSSMENTLDIGDKVLVNKFIYHIRPIARGDIVVFNGEGSWDPASPASSSNPVARAAGQFGHAVVGLFGISPGVHDYIKRVIGLPGDHVACCDAQGRVTVNGVPLNEKSYLYPDNIPSVTRFSITVPPGRLWVMGDHRNVSYDSRGHVGDPGGGTIPENQVVGRAFVILWPLSRFRVLSIPATFTAVNASSHALGQLAIPGGDASLAGAVALPLTWLERRARPRLRRLAGRGPRWRAGWRFPGQSRRWPGRR
jgi:signal peptidase I